MIESWNKVQCELDRWVDKGHIVKFWVRDDDAHECTEPLTRLRELARNYKISFGLAVIPGLIDANFLEFLGAARQEFFPMCHGWKHVNYGSNKKPGEFGDDRPFLSLLGDAQLAYNKFAEYFGGSNVIFVPPFGRISRPLMAVLPGLGFAGLSIGPTFLEIHLARLLAKFQIPAVKLGSSLELERFDVKIDLIDWRRRTAENSGLIADKILGHLRLRRRGFLDINSPIGILTHHLAHDEKVWELCDEVLDHLLRHPAVKFTSVPDEIMRLDRQRLSNGVERRN